ncbi:Uncharacterised protein [Vibrio cholerae]|nr:Uncharacterised protein [Vibrio cholerae]
MIPLLLESLPLLLLVSHTDLCPSLLLGGSCS